MHPLIRLAFFQILLSGAVLHSVAGNGSPKPVSSFSIHAANFQKLDQFLSSSLNILDRQGTGSAVSAESVGRVCSCQILDLESSNYSHQHVVLLAEKTNNGGTADYSIAKNRIQKEKKNLKKMFYDKVKLISEMQSAGSCKSMYFKLKTADSQLQLYEILNADIY